MNMIKMLSSARDACALTHLPGVFHSNFTCILLVIHHCFTHFQTRSREGLAHSESDSNPILQPADSCSYVFERVFFNTPGEKTGGTVWYGTVHVQGMNNFILFLNLARLSDFLIPPFSKYRTLSTTCFITNAPLLRT